jgi:hypothetical protein
MGKLVGVVTLVVIGIIIADALIHPTGVKALAAGSNTLVSTTSSALLGKAPKG